jgi:putative ABC transport system substrate-binding protein
MATPAMIGFLHSGSSNAFKQAVASFGTGLEQGGCIPKKDVQIEERWADGDFKDQLRAFADELIGLGPKVIVAVGGIKVGVVAQAAVQASSKKNTAIVFLGGRPARAGLAPGRGGKSAPTNVTGVDAYNAESYKMDNFKERLDRLRTVTPSGKIGVLINPDGFSGNIEKGETVKHGGATNKRRDAVPIEATNQTDLASLFASLKGQGISAVLVTPNSLFTSRRADIVALAAKHQLPAMYPWREYVDAGGLMSYGTDLNNLYRLVGISTGLIVNGKKPSQVDVRQPESSKFVINLKTAHDQGITIPPDMLADADEVIS